MKKKWISALAEVNKELLLILSIVGSVGLINLLIAGQRMALTMYNLPTLLAAYYFGRRRAVEASLASILLVVWMNMMNPTVLATQKVRMEKRWSGKTGSLARRSMKAKATSSTTPTTPKAMIGAELQA